MPRKNYVLIQLPPKQPDRCWECPLLGIVPVASRPKGSKETLVCCGTYDAMNTRIAKVRASERDSHHPLHRYCDYTWDSWMNYPDHKFPLNSQAYTELRMPFLQSLPLPIKFHGRNMENNPRYAEEDDEDEEEEPGNIIDDDEEQE